MSTRLNLLRHAAQRLPIWLRVTALVWLAVVVACAGLVAWALHVQREAALAQARDQAQTVHQLTLAGLTAMMITGTTDRAALFLDQIERTRDVKRLAVVRGDGVALQYGRPRVSSDAPRVLEVLRRGEPLYTELADEGGPRLEAVLPIVASRNYLGKDCLACHAVSEGAVVGAVTMDLSLAPLEAARRTFRWMIVFAAIAAGLLLLVPVYWLATRYVTRPLAALTRGLDGIRDGRAFDDRALPVVGDDEIARTARAFNGVLGRARELLDAERIAARVFEHALEGIIITDRDGYIVKVNRAFTRTTGYAAHEVIGRTPRILQSGRHDRAFYDAFWRTLLKDGVWSGDLWNRRRNGEVYVQCANISSVRDANGEIEHFIAIFNDVTQQRKQEAAIAYLAYHDPLTGLPNRAVFEDRVRQAITAARRHASRPVAVMFLDIDGFKQINDTLGHEVGDVVLKIVAQRLRGALREVDTVARLGGDEFTVLLPEVADQAAATAVGERLLAALQPLCRIGQAIVPLRASLGVSLFPQDGTTPEALLLKADEAMYRMKRSRQKTSCEVIPWRREQQSG